MFEKQTITEVFSDKAGEIIGKLTKPMNKILFVIQMIMLVIKLAGVYEMTMVITFIPTIIIVSTVTTLVITGILATAIYHYNANIFYVIDSKTEMYIGEDLKPNKGSFYKKLFKRRSALKFIKNDKSESNFECRELVSGLFGWR